MPEIGRELEGEHGVVQLENVADALANRRISGKLQQAAVVFAQLEFAGRAQHALALHTPQLAQLDEEGLAVFTRRQFRPHQSNWHANANPCVGSTADNIEQGGLADIHQANPQPVGIGVLRRFADLTHHHLAKWRCGGHSLLDLHAGHGQGVGELFRRKRRVAKLAQPAFRKLHKRQPKSTKLRKKTQIVFKEKAQVVHTVAQHGQAVDA